MVPKDPREVNRVNTKGRCDPRDRCWRFFMEHLASTIEPLRRRPAALCRPLLDAAHDFEEHAFEQRVARRRRVAHRSRRGECQRHRPWMHNPMGSLGETHSLFQFIQAVGRNGQAEEAAFCAQEAIAMSRPGWVVDQCARTVYVIGVVCRRRIRSLEDEYEVRVSVRVAINVRARRQRREGELTHRPASLECAVELTASKRDLRDHVQRRG